MQIDATFGPSAPEQGWVPAPRYLLRRSLILRELHTIQPCETLEVGPGAGMLLHELDARGFRCRALEMSEAAREIATALAHEAGRNIRFFERPQADWAGRFGMLMAFEVLEHIEHDLEALRQWRSWLHPGGTLLLSVPCHMRKWNPSDVWAGHFRRYEHSQLVDLVNTAGFEVEHILGYGFPVANIIERIRAWRLADATNNDATSESMRASSARSGTDRSYLLRWYPLLKSPIGKAVILASTWAQQPFLHADIGNGYLVRARAR